MGTKTVEIKQNAIVYGVKINLFEVNDSRAIQYTDDAQGMVPVTVNPVKYNAWDKTWIFDKIFPVMLKTDGTVDYKLNTNDQTLKATGGNSDINNIDYDGNAMIEVDRFYTKFSMDGDYECVQFSNVQLEGFEPIGFVRSNNTVADKIFLPMFIGCIDDNGKLRSIGDQTIKPLNSFNDSRTAAQKNGNGYDIESWAMDQIFDPLYYLIFKYPDHLRLGNDRGGVNLKTGTASKLGAINSYEGVETNKFMYMEDFLGNYLPKLKTGIISYNNNVYVKLKPPYSGSSINGYTVVNDLPVVVNTNNFVKSKNCNNTVGRYPTSYQSTNAHEDWIFSTDRTPKYYVLLKTLARGTDRYSFGTEATYTYNAYAGLTYMPPK